jgi:hypothetical protein
VLLSQYGETVEPAKIGRPGRPRKPKKRWPPGAVYATVKKTYARGTVVATRRTLVHGTAQDLQRALRHSKQSDQINTAFIERHNGTDRNSNARKVRKTYAFSKEWVPHVAVSWWVLLCYNFHYAHRSLAQRLADGLLRHRTPAMAIGIADRPLSVADLLSTPVVGFHPTPPEPAVALGLRHAVGPAP